MTSSTHRSMTVISVNSILPSKQCGELVRLHFLTKISIFHDCTVLIGVTFCWNYITWAGTIKVSLLKRIPATQSNTTCSTHCRKRVWLKVAKHQTITDVDARTKEWVRSRKWFRLICAVNMHRKNKWRTKQLEMSCATANHWIVCCQRIYGASHGGHFGMVSSVHVSTVARERIGTFFREVIWMWMRCKRRART